LTALEEKIGHKFRNKNLLGRAMTHSTANPKKCPSQDGENFEVLGDAALGNFFAMARINRMLITYEYEFQIPLF
jgi:dsRNA-specific ribonuclease